MKKIVKLKKKVYLKSHTEKVNFHQTFSTQVVEETCAYII